MWGVVEIVGIAGIGVMIDDTLPEHLRTACDELDKLKTPIWAYTIRTRNQQGEMEVHFDPSLALEKQYTLLSVNGRNPRRAEVKTYQEKKAKVISGAKTGLTFKTMPDAIKMIRPGSLKVISENEELIRYGFKPILDIPLAKKVMPKLEGELHFCKKRQMLERIKIVNVKSFTPIPSFKIEKLLSVAVFDRLPGGYLQLLETDMQLKGKKFFVGSLSQDSKTIYLDHVQVIFD